MQESLPSARLMVYALWETELRLVAMTAVDRSSAPPERAVLPARPVLERQADSAATLHMPEVAGPSEGFPTGAIHAAAAHAVAHLRFGSGRADDTAIKPLHQAVLGVLEDARVESLAMAELPGLRCLWQAFHAAPATEETSLNALLRRLTRALFDPAWADSHPWVEKGRSLYLDACHRGWPALRRAASILANDLGQMRVRFDAAGHHVWPAYRDDNTHLWQLPPGQAIASPQPLDRPDAGDGAPGGEGSRVNDSPSEGRLLGTVPEWDRLIWRYRDDWCSLIEMPPQEHDPAALSEQMKRQGAWIRRLARRLRKAALTRPQPVRAGAGGNIDEAALVDAGIALRAARTPDTDIYLQPVMAHVRRSIVFILDASVSTAGRCPPWLGASGTRLLDGMAGLTMLACAAFEQAGHDCEIFGFNSNTRHCVRIQPVKNRKETVFSPPVLARLAGLVPERSTRSGAAVRYAVRLLEGMERTHNANGALIVLVTDGHPHDVDMHDPLYLPEDLLRAALEGRRRGINVLVLTPDSDARAAPDKDNMPGWMHARVSSLYLFANALVHAIGQHFHR